MLPIPDTTVWSSSARLISVCLRRIAATAATREKSGSSGSRAMCAISGGRSAPPGAKDMPPKVRWSRKSTSGPPSSKANRIRRCGCRTASVAESSGRSRRRRQRRPAGDPLTRNCPLIPRCAMTASPSSSAHHRYLPRRRTAVIRVPGQHGPEVGGAAGVPADGAVVVDLAPRRSDGRPDGWSDRGGRPRLREVQAPDLEGSGSSAGLVGLRDRPPPVPRRRCRPSELRSESASPASPAAVGAWRRRGRAVGDPFVGAALSADPLCRLV